MSDLRLHRSDDLGDLREIPFVPLGTYRYEANAETGGDGTQFWARRTPMELGQFLRTCVVGWSIGAVVVGVIWTFHGSMGR